MNEDLYNAGYLQKTAELLRDFKQQTYAPFVAEQEGELLDVGCGHGFDVINLAKICKGASVTGVDIDTHLIEAAQQNVARQTIPLPNVHFILGNSEQLPFSEQSISGLRSERLMQHLPNAEKTFAEFYRVLKPNKAILVAETDWKSMVLYVGNPKIRQKLKDFLVQRHVANGSAAATLVDSLKKALFRNIAIKIFPFVSISFKQTDEMLKLTLALAKMKDEGLISETDKNGFIEEILTADKAHYYAGSINLVIVTAVK